MSCRIIFVRHGQSEGNREHIYLGHTNLDLSDLGYKQAQRVGEFLKDVKIDKIYSSDLLRAYNTSLPLSDFLKIQPVIKENLREIFAGEWENKSYSYLNEAYPVSYGIWQSNIGMAHPDGGESVADLQKRIVKAVTEIAENNDGKTVAVFTHATPIRTFFAFVKGMELEKIKNLPWANNASVSEVVYEEGKFTEVSYSNDGFLSDIATGFPKGV